MLVLVALLMVVTKPPSRAFVTASGGGAGGWTWFHEPRAVELNGTIYYGYIRGNGDIAIRTIDAATQTTGDETVLHAGLQGDDHNNPTILIRESDKRLMVFYSRHSGAEMYTRISSEPESIASFGPEVNLDASLGGTAYTYPSPVQLAGEQRDPIHLFFRDPIDDDTTAMRYSTSLDDGGTWAPQTLLYSDAGRSAYWKIANDGLRRIDFAVSDGHPFYDGAVKIGHFYYEGGVYHRTDGTPLEGLPPYDFSDVSTIYGGDTEAWVWDVAVGDDGMPRVTYTTWPTPDDARLNWARWTGSEWESHEVAWGGSKDLDPVYGHFYTGGMVLDHEDPGVVYASRESGLGQFEMWRYTTTDNAATWDGEVLTSRSEGLNIRPVSIRNHGPDMAVLWMYAPTYRNYLTYEAGTRGA